MISNVPEPLFLALTLRLRSGQAGRRREKREESFMPVEITGGWVRAEKRIGGRIVLGWFAPGSFGGTESQ